jgi:hypothetical protein
VSGPPPLPSDRVRHPRDHVGVRALASAPVRPRGDTGDTPPFRARHADHSTASPNHRTPCQSECAAPARMPPARAPVRSRGDTGDTPLFRARHADPSTTSPNHRTPRQSECVAPDRMPRTRPPVRPRGDTSDTPPFRARHADHSTTSPNHRTPGRANAPHQTGCLPRRATRTLARRYGRHAAVPGTTRRPLDHIS